MVGLQASAVPLSRTVINTVENLACRLAERYQGSITVNHLMPYLPMSLELLRACLDHMVDGHTIYATAREHMRVYEFAAYRETPVQAGILQVKACVSCHLKLPPKRKRVLCANCIGRLGKELRKLAARADWVGQALPEHELLYIAAQHPGPHPATTLASHSQSTLHELRQTLERLSLDGYLHQDMDVETGVITYRFPEVEYPQKHYQDNLACLQLCVAKRVQRKKTWLLCGLGLLVLGWVTYHLKPSPSPVRPPFQQENPPRVPQQAAPQPTLPRYETMPAPPYGQAYHNTAKQNATLVQVSLRQNGFVPVDMTIAASWNTTTPLSPLRPAGITKEPPYQGEHQVYGTLKLGTMDNPIYSFVFDLLPGPHPLLYFDRNRNSDLTDDSGPLTNQGSGIFATRIHLPLAHLIKEMPFPETFTLWFFTNDRLWSSGSVAHYSRTQWQGTVSLEGRTYTAYIADTGNNDADFTNDGIAIDVDGNGKIDRHNEVFRPHRVARIHNKDYVFEITW